MRDERRGDHPEQGAHYSGDERGNAPRPADDAAQRHEDRQGGAEPDQAGDVQAGQESEGGEWQQREPARRERVVGAGEDQRQPDPGEHEREADQYGHRPCHDEIRSAENEQHEAYGRREEERHDRDRGHRDPMPARACEAAPQQAEPESYEECNHASDSDSR